MNFSAVNRGKPDQSTHRVKLSPHTTGYDSVSDSGDSTEPPAGHAPRNHTKSPFKQHPGSLSSSGRINLDVPLKRPPASLKAYREDSIGEDGSDVPVMSDLTPRGRPSNLSKLVNDVSRPSDPDETQTGDSSNATSTTPARGRGRPKGSFKKFKGLPGTAAAGRQARQIKPRPYPEGFVGFPKRRGRPPKFQSPPPRELYYRTNVQFFPFLCEWMDCKAELHNLETLRRHVSKVHGDSIECLWGKCGRLEKPPEFEDDEGFEDHIEEAHLVPLSWHVGDGPNNLAERGLKKRKEDDDIPDYLKDEHGNQVTPSIRDQEEEDLLTWRKNRRKLKELLIRMNDNLPDEVDEERDVKQQED
ncbi:hypothetical protein FPOAC2_06979 [Fusarium poae]|jgi:hypothetical protein|uniref:hypothetical protein n=1 Tax=Fusarium poae TaxID=36050 RepID=UPI001CE9EAD4|nr:hypothetical protein FPOAC1_006847 [Fusarium poae]KAG8673533.1 hypothetical protein FPOAC1_006847 [Fusarium poae]